MNEVNRNPDLLPNSSLLFECREDGCASRSKIDSRFDFSEEVHDFPPNYICHKQTICIVVLTGPNLTKSMKMGIMLNLLKPQQVRFCVVTLQ